MVLLSYLHNRNPLTSDPSLQSACTGVHAYSIVNVDKAKDVGDAIFVSMEGMTAAEYTFKRNEQAITLDTKFAVRIGGIELMVLQCR